MTKTVCPYTYPHKSRMAKVNYICGIGGYSCRDGTFPIEFNVATYHVDFSFDHIWKTYAKELIPSECDTDPMLMHRYVLLAKRLHPKHEASLWEWGQEDAVRDLDERESDTYFMLWDGTKVDVKLALYGRGGKHLVLTEWDGRDFSRLRDDDLREEMLMQVNPSGTIVNGQGCLRPRYEWVNWTTEQIDLLYRYIRQCERDFTPSNASKEVEYQGAFNFLSNIVNPAWDEERKTIADHEATVRAAKIVKEAVDHNSLRGEELDDAFVALCSAAGVTQEEVDTDG